MVSDHAKLPHDVSGTPMLRLAYNAAAGLEPDEIFVVIGQDADRVRATLEGLPVRFVIQSEQLGTGHAVMAARDRLVERPGDAVVLFADGPSIKPSTLRKLVEHHRGSGAVTTLVTARADNPFGYGRIL